MPQFSLFAVQGNELKQGFACTACALHQNPDLKTNCMKSAGSLRPRFLFIGHSPGREDDRIGSPMTGENGRIFRDLLRDAGYFKEEVHFTNCLKCCTHDKNGTKTHWNSCKQHFYGELNSLDPEVVVAVGADAVKWITGHSGVTKLARKGLPIEGATNRVAYPIQQPAALLHAEGEEKFALRQRMVDELRWIRGEALAGRIGRVVRNDNDYQICRTPQDVDSLFEELETRDDFAIDLETSSLYPDEDEKILAIGFSWQDRQGVALPLYAPGIVTLNWWEEEYLESYILPKLRDILRRKKVFGHNLIQFDQKWCRAKLDVRNLNVDFDTQFCHYCLNEERGTHDLEQLALLHTDMAPWKRDFNTQDTEQLCLYLCKDVDATFRLKGILYPQLSERQRWLFHELLIPLAKELFEVEWNGVAVDDNALAELSALLQSEIDKETAILRSDKFVRLFEIAENCQLDHDSPDQLRLLFDKYLKWPMIKKTDGGKYSTDKEVLAHYADQPVAASILKIRQRTTLKNNFCQQLRNEARHGRIHTSYKPHGTVTGRLASSNPNLQNMPREATAEKVFGADAGNPIKRIFAAGPGNCFIEADFAQAELRVLASISKDKNLIGIYQRGEDVHTATAASVYNIPLSQVTKEQRNLAKPVNFGIVYGMTIDGLIKKFEQGGSTARVAEQFLAAHKKSFPAVWSWMDEQERLVRLQRYQETYFGRRRRYAEIDNAAIRQAYNFPIQSLASDLTLISIIRISRALRQLNLPGAVALTVYDSITCECPIENMWQVAEVMRHVMTTIHFDWMLVEMGADLKAGLNWGDLKEIDVLNRKIAA